MVGNDLVDLAESECTGDAVHPRFDARVFAASELEALERCEDRGRMRWMLWAAKESAYKLARRQSPGLVFAPSRFVVHLQPDLSGQVRLGGQSFPVRVVQAGESIHAVARSSQARDEDVISEVAPLVAIPHGEEDADAPSRAVRALAITRLAPRLGVKTSELRIERRERVPWLHLRGSPITTELSLSHHGRFVAFAARLLQDQFSC